MTFKLMKYELRSMLRTFVPLWCIILLLAILNRFTLRVDGLADLLGGVPAALLLIAYILVILAVEIVTVVFMILRFYNGLLKDEGYLMFTLPVTAGQLLLSKLLSAAILIISTTVVSLLSVLVLTVGNETVQQIGEFMEIMVTYEQVSFTMGLVYQLLLAVVICGILAAFGQILHGYLAMAIGQLANRGKVGFSILSYIGISLVLETVGLAALTEPLMEKLMELDTVLFTGASASGLIWGIFGVLIVTQAVQIVAFYIPTWWILKNKLNLE